MADRRPSKKQQGKLRVAIRKPGYLGLWGGLSIAGHDLYSTHVAGGMVKGPDGQHRPAPIFNRRGSYHASGQHHTYNWIAGFDESRTRSEPGHSPPPAELVGARFMGSNSYASHATQGGYTVKDKHPYVNLVVDYSSVRHHPSFALDFWCLGEGSPPIEELYGDLELLTCYCLPRGATQVEALRTVELHVQPKLLRTAEVDWTTPRLAAVVWTLPTRGWSVWAKVTGEAFPAPGGVSIMRDNEGRVNAVHHEGGKPPLDELGPIFQTSFRPTP